MLATAIDAIGAGAKEDTGVVHMRENYNEERGDVLRAAACECQGFEMDSGETSLGFASSLRYPALVVDERFAAPSPPMADLLLFHPVVLVLPTPFYPIMVIGPERLAHEFPGGLHALLPSLLTNVRRA